MKKVKEREFQLKTFPGSGKREMYSKNTKDYIVKDKERKRKERGK